MLSLVFIFLSDGFEILLFLLFEVLLNFAIVVGHVAIPFAAMYPRKSPKAIATAQSNARAVMPKPLRTIRQVAEGLGFGARLLRRDLAGTSDARSQRFA
jgi:hypothetical protein